MARYSTPSSSYKNFIYYICCDGKLYIGQSTEGLGRIRQHCNNAYRENIIDDSGAETVYESIRKNGLCNTNIYIFDEAQNYGLDEKDFQAFNSFFMPRSGDIVGDKINAAEIIHILRALYDKQYKLTNISMGGQGSSYVSPENPQQTILTRAMSPEDALQILNMSQRSREDILKTNELINKYIFTDEWKTITANLSNYDKNLTVNEKKYIDFTWTEFVSFLENNLIETLDFKDNKWTSSYVTEAINDFVSGRQKVLNNMVQLTGTLFKDQLTEAQQDLFQKQSNRKLITAHFSVDPEAVTNYITEAISYAISRSIKSLYKGQSHDMRRMTEEEKKIEKQLRAQLWGHAKKHHDFSLDKLQSFKIVNITKWFDFDSVHLRGNSEWLKNTKRQPGISINHILKGYSLLTFAWYYEKIVPGFNYQPEYILTPQNTFGSIYSFGGEPNAIYSRRQIERNSWLTNRMHTAMQHLNFLNKNWDVYFKDMIAVYRQEYGRPTSMGETSVRFDQEEPLFYTEWNSLYIIYNSNLYTIKNLDDITIY